MKRILLFLFLFPVILFAQSGDLVKVTISGVGKTLSLYETQSITPHSSGSRIFYGNSTATFYVSENLDYFRDTTCNVFLYGHLLTGPEILINKRWIDRVEPAPNGKSQILLRGGKKYSLTELYSASLSQLEESTDCGGGGVTDHGDLTGLADDDHTQYHNDARGDARYFTEAEHLNTSAGAGDAGKPIKLDAAGHIDATMINDADVDHGTLGGLTDDDHAQYALLAGRATGQTLKGGTASGETLTLMSTNHATKGLIVFGASSYNEATETFAFNSTGILSWASRGSIRANADGVFQLLDAAGTSFGRLQFGGTTSSFPSLKRSTTILQVRLADDSDYAPFSAGTIRADVSYQVVNTSFPLDIRNGTASAMDVYRFSNLATSTYTSGTGNNISTIGCVYTPSGAGSGSFRVLNLPYSLNGTSGAQTGTATGIFINATETTLNGMIHNLMDLQVGSASRFKVTNSGAVVFAPMTATAASALTPAEGMMVMVSDTNGTFTSVGFWGYMGGAWTALHL